MSVDHHRKQVKQHESRTCQVDHHQKPHSKAGATPLWAHRSACQSNIIKKHIRRRGGLRASIRARVSRSSLKTPGAACWHDVSRSSSKNIHSGKMQGLHWAPPVSVDHHSKSHEALPTRRVSESSSEIPFEAGSRGSSRVRVPSVSQSSSKIRFEVVRFFLGGAARDLGVSRSSSETTIPKLRPWQWRVSRSSSKKTYPKRADRMVPVSNRSSSKKALADMSVAHHQKLYSKDPRRVRLPAHRRVSVDHHLKLYSKRSRGTWTCRVSRSSSKSVSPTQRSTRPCVSRSSSKTLFGGRGRAGAVD